MRFLVVVASLVLITGVLPDASAGKVQAQVKAPERQAKTPEVSKPAEDGNRKNDAPVVEAWAPKTASVDTVIHLSGYRLLPSDSNKTRTFFIQNGVEFTAGYAGGWWPTNNQHNLPQTLLVIVPEEVAQGQAQIVVEFNGRRSNPATITITEWKLPVVQRLNPSRGAPGTLVRIEGEDFHANDEIEVTDSSGEPIKVNSSGQVFGVPADAPEGILSVRVGSRKFGKRQFTEPVTFTVTNEPSPVELLTDDTKSVAPGQWVDLQISNIEQLKRSELTEVVFKQAGRTIIVAAPKPFRPHVGVPSELAAGEVQLQLRTWRDGRPSEWSEPANFELADKPVGPWIDSIRLAKESGSWAALAPGPDRKTSFTVSPGDEVVFNGLWPVADASKLKVSLTRSGEVITLAATEFDEKATWFADIKVRLPESIGVGEWRMTVEAEGSRFEVPIVIRVVKR